MDRMILAILIMVVAETAWALFSAETGLNLFVFYAVLVAVSAVFWLPGREAARPTKGRAPRPRDQQIKP